LYRFSQRIDSNRFASKKSIKIDYFIKINQRMSFLNDFFRLLEKLTISRFFAILFTLVIKTGYCGLIKKLKKIVLSACDNPFYSIFDKIFVWASRDQWKILKTILFSDTQCGLNLNSAAYGTRSDPMWSDMFRCWELTGFAVE